MYSAQRQQQHQEEEEMPAPHFPMRVIGYSEDVASQEKPIEFSGGLESMYTTHASLHPESTADVTAIHQGLLAGGAYAEGAK
jgi:hypothetical protein